MKRQRVKSNQNKSIVYFSCCPESLTVNEHDERKYAIRAQRNHLISERKRPSIVIKTNKKAHQFIEIKKQTSRRINEDVEMLRAKVAKTCAKKQMNIV